ncbi:hypothetical protein [uncultured Chryseobacterium sp.]|uniref:hypothetical protein n=1 Tax=uncultured Chryseobacterium sp. TaxID=259322 RepID=UPI0025EB063B|nr:hypothetical protein [uncultured Chryseobacterium sp.]
MEYAVVRNTAERWINKPAGGTNKDLTCLNFDLIINYKTLKMKKQLKSLQGKKLNSNDMISIKGGKKALEPTKTMVLTNSNGHTSDDGSTDDSDWASGSDL